MTQAPTDALRLVPGKRLRPDARVLPGDVLRVVETFTNPDLLTKGDVVIVQSQGDDGNIVALNLFRNTAQYGFNPTRYAFVHRPATRMKADYSHMLAAAPASPLPGGGDMDWQDKAEGLESDLRQAVLVAWKRGAEEWCRLNYPQWVDWLEACHTPAAPTGDPK